VSQPVICELAIPNQDYLADHIRANASLSHRMAQPDSRVGKTLALCGAGPSLNDHLYEIVADEIWACNSALPYLIHKGLSVTHGFTVDQGVEMLGEREWREPYDVEYIIASTVHPDIPKHLTTHGRDLLWIHNFCGLKNPAGWNGDKSFELALYGDLYPSGPMVGYGLNSVPRAVCLALWMGFSKIMVHGADHAAKPTGVPMPAWRSEGWIPFLQQCQLYADGRTAFDAFGENVTLVQNDMETVLGCSETTQRWITRPDMVISAQHMAQMARDHSDRITLVGNTLPNAMLDKPAEWFATFPHLNTTQGVEGLTMLAA
jgi:hypothetical protein